VKGARLASLIASRGASGGEAPHRVFWGETGRLKAQGAEGRLLGQKRRLTGSILNKRLFVGPVEKPRGIAGVQLLQPLRKWAVRV